jgi:transposase
MAHKGYPPEFRRRALDLVAAGKTVTEVARLLEVSNQSIYTWRRQELIDRGELPVHRRAAELLKESVRPKGGSGRSA